MVSVQRPHDGHGPHQLHPPRRAASPSSTSAEDEMEMGSASMESQGGRKREDRARPTRLWMSCSKRSRLPGLQEGVRWP